MMPELQALMKSGIIEVDEKVLQNKTGLTLLSAFTIFFEVEESNPNDSGVEVADSLLSSKAAVL